MYESLAHEVDYVLCTKLKLVVTHRCAHLMYYMYMEI